MYCRTRIALAALAAGCVLAVAVGSAGARRFEFSEQRFGIVFEEVGYSGGGTSARCKITLAGSFHSRTISKVAGALIGYITAGNVVPPCIEGSARLLPETLPWHIRYQSFSGVLPRISSIEIGIVGWAYLQICIGQSCLFRSTAERPVSWFLNLEATGRVTSVRWDEANQVPLNGISAICPQELRLAGTGSFTVLNSSTAITVRLVQ